MTGYAACGASTVPHPKSPTCEPVEHDGAHGDGCVPCKVTTSRRSVLLHRALHAPQGLTPYEFTKGFTKADALMFWTDARALGLITVGQSKRGARTFALPSYAAPRERR